MEYDRVHKDMQDEVIIEEGSREYMDQLQYAYEGLDSYETLLDVFGELSSKFHGDYSYEYDEMPFLLISQAFRDGFLLGLEANRRLIGTDFDYQTNKLFVDLIDQIIEDSGGNIIEATEEIRGIGSAVFNNNFANKEERGSYKFHHMHNPLDIVVETVTSGLYAEDDELQHSLFKEGFGIARLSQLKYQQKIDRRFGRLVATIQPIDSE